MSHYDKLIDEVADVLVGTAAEAEQLNRLPEATIDAIRHTRVVRALQPKSYGGDECHPVEFAEAVMRIASLNSSAGWCAGVIGVHSWQIAGFDPKLQDEIWGADPETWVSSPYAPLGVLERVDGGYKVKGRIPFSSGGEASKWAITGALLPQEDGTMALRHIVLPRDDYWFDQDSWNVLGLKGTGSKDLVCDGATIPDYRVYRMEDFDNGQNMAKVGNHADLYKLPFPTFFSYAINCASQGIAEGAMNAVLENAKKRVNARGIKSLDDDIQVNAIGEAAADVRAGRAVLLDVGNRLYDEVAAEGKISLQSRIQARADGVRAIRRSVEAIERVFNFAGGMALKTNTDVNRGLRDAKTTLAHICNTQHPIQIQWTKVTLGLEHDGGAAFW